MKKTCLNCAKSKPYEPDKFFVICESFEAWYQDCGVIKLEPAAGNCRKHVAEEGVQVEKYNPHEKDYVKEGKIHNFVSCRTPPRMARGL